MSPTDRMSAAALWACRALRADDCPRCSTCQVLWLYRHLNFVNCCPAPMPWALRLLVFQAKTMPNPNWVFASCATPLSELTCIHGNIVHFQCKVIAEATTGRSCKCDMTCVATWSPLIFGSQQDCCVGAVTVQRLASLKNGGRSESNETGDNDA